MINHSLKKCFSTLGCPDLDLDAVLSLAQDHEIDGLEIRSLDDRIDLPVYFRSLPGGTDAVRKKLETLAGGAFVLGTSCKLVGAKEGAREELLEFAELASEIDCPYLRVFGGGQWGTPLTEANYEEAIDFLNWWQAQRELHQWDVDVLIETHDAFSASPPLLTLFDQLGRSVGIIWDTHHTWKLGGERPAYSWEQLGEFTRHVHIKDSISEPSARHPYTYVLPGRGEMPLHEVMAVLQEHSFSGAVTLEWEKMWHPYLADLSEALIACRDCDLWSLR
jgi:sugar phosphate isomerase/epimerase